MTFLAYLMIVAGLLWVTMPYLLRDQITWGTKHSGIWRVVAGATFVFGLAIVACAVVAY